MTDNVFDIFARDINLIVNSMEHNVKFTLGVIGFLFIVHFINKNLNSVLNVLGIYPRSLFGLVGIVFSPFLHGDFNHLLFNSIPLFSLMHMVLLAGFPAFVCITLVIMIIGGLGTWAVGRRSLHIGSSSVIMGYFGYLVTQSYVSPSFISIITIVVCLYYFGGLVLSLVPTDKEVSWEGHTFGFLGGIAAYYMTPGLLATASRYIAF